MEKCETCGHEVDSYGCTNLDCDREVRALVQENEKLGRAMHASAELVAKLHAAAKELVDALKEDDTRFADESRVSLALAALEKQL